MTIAIVVVVVAHVTTVHLLHLSEALTTHGLEVLAFVVTLHILSEGTWHSAVSRHKLPHSVLSVESTVNLGSGTVRQLLLVIVIHANVLESIELWSSLVILFHVLNQVFAVVLRLDIMFVVAIVETSFSDGVIVAIAAFVDEIIITVVLAKK